MKHTGSQKRDLRTGRPFWLARGPLPFKTDGSAAGIDADVVVVGIGVSGALVSDALLSAGLSEIRADSDLFAHAGCFEMLLQRRD